MTRSVMDWHSDRWRYLGNRMVAAERRMWKRDDKCCTGSRVWIDGLPRRYSKNVFPGGAQE